MAKDLATVESAPTWGPFLKLFKEAVASLKVIAAEKKKQTKLLEKISEDITNISTDVEEMK